MATHKETWNIHTIDVPYMVSETVVGLSVVLCNVLLILAVYTVRALQTPNNCFIVWRAMADLLFGVVIVLAALLPRLNLVTNFYPCLFLKAQLISTSNVTILMLAGIAFDRFMAVYSPFLYCHIITFRSAGCVSAGIWTLGFGLAFVVAILHKDPSEYVRCEFVQVIDIQYMFYIVFLPVILPVMTGTIAAFVYIFYVVRQKHLSDQALVVSLRRSLEELQQQRRHARVHGMTGLFLIVIAHVVCWFPLNTLNVVVFLSPADAERLPNRAKVLSVFVLMSHVCSMLNPLLYMAFNTKMRLAVKSVVCCRGKTGNIFDERPSFSNATTMDISSTVIISRRHKAAKRIAAMEMTTTSLCSSTTGSMTTTGPPQRSQCVSFNPSPSNLSQMSHSSPNLSASGGAPRTQRSIIKKTSRSSEGTRSGSRTFLAAANVPGIKGAQPQLPSISNRSLRAFNVAEKLLPFSLKARRSSKVANVVAVRNRDGRAHSDLRGSLPSTLTKRPTKDVDLASRHRKSRSHSDCELPHVLPSTLGRSEVGLRSRKGRSHSQ